jgi:hypothetical protein
MKTTRNRLYRTRTYIIGKLGTQGLKKFVLTMFPIPVKMKNLTLCMHTRVGSPSTNSFD